MRRKVIYREDGSPYLIRYYLLKFSFLQVVIHKILQSDYDCLHDHPWNFLSIILKGGYHEGTTPEQVLSTKESEHFKKTHGINAIYYRWFNRFSILYRKAEWKHRLQLTQGYVNVTKKTKVYKEKAAITLVIMFKRRREWGFFTKSGWLHWTKYESKQNCE